MRSPPRPSLVARRLPSVLQRRIGVGSVSVTNLSAAISRTAGSTGASTLRGPSFSFEQSPSTSTSSPGSAVEGATAIAGNANIVGRARLQGSAGGYRVITLGTGTSGG